MRNTGAAAGLLAVMLATSAVAQSKCVLKQIGELSTPVGRGVAVVEAQINDHPVMMAVDTGSFATTLFRSTPEKIGLPVKLVDRATAYGIGGSENVGEVGVREFKVGPLVARNIILPVVGRLRGDDLGGLLGIGFLRQTDIEFDYPDGKLRFFRPEGCTGDQVVYWGKAYAVAPIQSNYANGTIEVDVKLSGQTIRALVDTGFSRTTVTPLLASRLASAGAAPAPAGVLAGIGRGTLRASVVTFDSFSFGDETIKNAKLNVADLWSNNREVQLGSRIATSTVHEPDIILGADFFRSHRVYVSRAQNKVYVSYVGGPVFDTSLREESRSPAPATAPP